MANDKREQARIAFIERFEKYHHREANRVVTDAFESGYTAAEGIPQADGWVDVKCSNCGKIVTVGNDADTPLPT